MLAERNVLSLAYLALAFLFKYKGYTHVSISVELEPFGSNTEYELTWYGVACRVPSNDWDDMHMFYVADAKAIEMLQEVERISADPHYCCSIQSVLGAWLGYSSGHNCATFVSHLLGYADRDGYGVFYKPEHIKELLS